MDRTRSIIRFNIEGKWSTEEMGTFFLDLDDLYMLLESLEAAYFRIPSGPRGRFKRDLRSISKQLKGFNPGAEFLRIVQIQYGSPGIQDIAGVGVIVGHVKDFILKIIENVSSRRERELRNTELEIENARRFLQLRRDYNLTEEELIYLIQEINTRQRNIEQLIRENKLISVEEVGQLPPGR
ncbi:MAG TPA: hypothetical protein VE732_01810 [Nitrososphaera sp.]|jgi:hypothetical protein|nr:hypothetical protein [Nitrososphaera sp.]